MLQTTTRLRYRDERHVRFGLRATFGCALLFAAALMDSSEARAQNPPPSLGAPIFDLVTRHPGVLSSYEHFTTSFVAGPNNSCCGPNGCNTTVTFAFREQPAFF